MACPWPIRRFINPQAEFLFVEEKDLLEQARQQHATPFDAPKIETIKLNHRGPCCTFEAIIEDYALSDPQLQKLALYRPGRGHQGPGKRRGGRDWIAVDCSGVRCNGHLERRASCETIPDLRCPLHWDQE